MRKILQSALVLLALSTPALAASAADFYLTLLRRGTADVDAGRNAEAVANLRIAAFGLVDSIEHYEIAQAYLAIALDRMEQPDQAREAVRRILAAEKIEKKFRGIALPETTRIAFEAVAKKVLAAEAAALSGGAIAKPSEPVIVDRVDVITETRKPADPSPATPATATPKQEQPPPPKPQVPAQVSQPRQSEAPRSAPAAKPATARNPDFSAQLAAAERALSGADITEARRIYREVLTAPALDRAALIRVAEGFYRSRDFANTLAAFERAGTLRSGEEPYRYYIAVAAFEVGQFDRARRELKAALPWIEMTPDVQRYRAKIEARP
jgi:tetratricopeptide (TPR) repeat protein